jgi:hypothetical protein
MGLPFKYHKSKSDGDEAAVKARSFADADGNLVNLRMIGERLGAIEHDILMVWSTMAMEQSTRSSAKTEPGKLRVYYTVSYLTQRLRRSLNTRSKIRAAIKELLNYKITVKNFAFMSNTNEMAYRDETINLISKHGRVKTLLNSDGKVVDTASYYVDFDESIVKNIARDLVSVVSEDDYFSLKCGVDRRTLVFLNAKRKAFGNSYAYTVSELSSIIGIEGIQPSKQRERILSSLRDARESTRDFDYNIVKQSGVAEWDILIEFKDIEEVELSEDGKVFRAMETVYGKDRLGEIDLCERDVQLINEEFCKYWLRNTPKESTKYSLAGDEIVVGYFALDLAVHQVIKTGYQLTGSIKKLAKLILNTIIEDRLELPQGYRYFVLKQASEIERKKVESKVLIEKSKREVLELEHNENLRKSFNNAYQALVMKSPKLKDVIWGQAEDLLALKGFDPETPAYDLELEREAREIAFARYNDGSLLDLLEMT